MEGVTIAENSVTLNTSKNVADQLFGFTTNSNGGVQLISNNTNDIDDQINVEIQKQLVQSHKIVQQIQDANPNSKLSAQQIRGMYDEFSNDGMIVF